MRIFQPGPVDTTGSPYASLKTLPFTNVSVLGGFWADRQKVNREFSLRHGYEMLKEVGTHQNFLIAAGKMSGEWSGHRSRDSDLYKWLEAVAYELAAKPDRELQEMVDEAIELIASTQAKDGYLNTYYQHLAPDKRWTNIEFGHELYMAGHLMQAAVAHRRATGKDDLLQVACRFTDYISSVFGPDRRKTPSGHPEIEMALIELSRETRDHRYLDLGIFFIDQRGYDTLGNRFYGSWYYPDQVPVREASKIEGHAVRALYLNAGVTDAYIESGEEPLLHALERQWSDMTTKKMYITGGVGSRRHGESFGDEYELPNDRSYCETCAAIASIMWNWRMLLVTGEGRYADVIERSLYNGFLSGVSADGKRFFYLNPLFSTGDFERSKWFGCACCPPNVMRLMSSIQHYIATFDKNGIQLHQYIPSKIESVSYDKRITVGVDTNYPWEGLIGITVEETHGGPWSLSVRIPEWSDMLSLRINGKSEELNMARGYVIIDRKWEKGDTLELEMPIEPRFTVSHPRIHANRGSVAIERGPLVYCLEQIDHDSSANILDVEIDTSAPLQAEWRDDILGGVMAVKTSGSLVEYGPWGNEIYRTLSSEQLNKRPVQLTAVPYYAWANRGKGAMCVWIPKAETR
jgi:DUF1680 family protein